MGAPAGCVALWCRSQWSFPNTTTKLLYERPVRQELLQCSQVGAHTAAHIAGPAVQRRYPLLVPLHLAHATADTPLLTRPCYMLHG